MKKWKKKYDYFEKPNRLLKNIKKNMPRLENLLNACEDHWGQEDLVYRFYHESYKVYRSQDLTIRIYDTLRKISPHKDRTNMNEHYLNILKQGASGRQWKPEDNGNWDEVTRPFLEAFFHSRYFLEMAVKYGKTLDSAPARMPSGWAALLELYNIR
jgi:hypothetical protein